jgi:hypothetical protein
MARDARCVIVKNESGGTALVISTQQRALPRR